MKTGKLLCSLLTLAFICMAAPANKAHASDRMFVKADLASLVMTFGNVPQHPKRLHHPPPPPPRHYGWDRGRRPMAPAYYGGPHPYPPRGTYSRPRYYPPPPPVASYKYRHQRPHHPHYQRYRR